MKKVGHRHSQAEGQAEAAHVGQKVQAPTPRQSRDHSHQRTEQEGTVAGMKLPRERENQTVTFLQRHLALGRAHPGTQAGRHTAEYIVPPNVVFCRVGR
jgi:hypothetical protein